MNEEAFRELTEKLLKEVKDKLEMEMIRVKLLTIEFNKNSVLTPIELTTLSQIRNRLLLNKEKELLKRTRKTRNWQTTWNKRNRTEVSEEFIKKMGTRK